MYAMADTDEIVGLRLLRAIRDLGVYSAQATFAHTRAGECALARRGPS
jgi:hypothetical protein